MVDKKTLEMNKNKVFYTAHGTMVMHSGRTESFNESMKIVAQENIEKANRMIQAIEEKKKNDLKVK